MLTADLLQTAIADYHRQLRSLKELKNWSDQSVLAMLRERDRIQFLIDHLAQQPVTKALATDKWLLLSEDDALLGQWNDRLLTLDQLPIWRNSINPPEHHWWWHPKASETKPILSWLWGGLTIALLTLSLAFAKDIATRFFDDAPGLWSSIGAIVPTILALFATGGVLTKVGQQAIDTYLAHRAPPRYKPLVRCSLALGLAVMFFLGHSIGLPWAAHQYHSAGINQYQKSQLTNAQTSFQRALRLHPDFPAANHSLGLTHEDLRDFDQAKTNYATAIQGGSLESVNNLARLQILDDKDYASAAVLLKTALNDPQRDPNDTVLEYGLRKNLGWAWLKQERHLSAEGELRRAIILETTLTDPQPDAHCLLAQVLEAQQKQPDANTAWETCLRHATKNPQDDHWSGIAAKALGYETETNTADTPSKEETNQ